MRVLFATAEIEPLVSTGGLGAASAGLTAALREAGVDVEVVVPDYGGVELEDEVVTRLEVPVWVGPARARRGRHGAVGPVTLIDVPGIARPSPYIDPSTGEGWGDNDHRFFAWSRAVAALVADDARAGGAFDVVHVNDWHAATVLGHLPPGQRTVCSVHNLAHQGWADAGWVPLLGRRSDAFRRSGGVNALAGAIALADRVVAVSPSYATEIRTDSGGMGLADLLRARGEAVVGILNGIDTHDWDPAVDPHIAAHYGPDTLDAKEKNAGDVCETLGLDDGPGPLVVVVSRFDHQKGIDMLLDVGSLVTGMPARLAVLGSGDRATEARAAALAAAHPGRVAFRQGYDRGLSHRMFAAGDLTVVPSRFEPCGLTQMQAMRYGTLPVVTDVGGLHDTVVDADAAPRSGTGIVMGDCSAAAVIDGLHRGLRLWSNRSRRRSAQRRGMRHDWSWHGPAGHYVELYESLA